MQSEEGTNIIVIVIAAMRVLYLDHSDTMHIYAKIMQKCIYHIPHNVHVPIQYSCVENVSPEVEAECQMFNENGIKPSLQVDLLKVIS